MRSIDPSLNKSYIIFSVMKGIPADYDNHADMTNILRDFGISAKVVQGCYEGVKELAFMVEDTGENWEIAATQAFKIYNQDSILFIGPDKHNKRSARLLFSNAGTKEIGHFIPVSKDKAIASTGWTYDLEQCQYYVCERVSTIKAEAANSRWNSVNNMLLQHYTTSLGDVDVVAEEFQFIYVDWDIVDIVIHIAEQNNLDKVID